MSTFTALNAFYLMFRRSWEERLGIKRKLNIRGKDIPVLFTKGEYQIIVEYAIEELHVCQTLFVKVIDLLASVNSFRF